MCSLWPALGALFWHCDSGWRAQLRQDKIIIFPLGKGRTGMCDCACGMRVCVRISVSADVCDVERSPVDRHATNRCRHCTYPLILHSIQNMKRSSVPWWIPRKRSRNVGDEKSVRMFMIWCNWVLTDGNSMHLCRSKVQSQHAVQFQGKIWRAVSAA